MNTKNNVALALFIIIVGLITAVSVVAWTNPSATPPGGGGALFYSGGNVGIGTTGPGYKLDVSGDAQISNTLRLAPGDGRLLTIQQLSGAGNAVYNTNNFHEFQTDTTLRATITDSYFYSANSVGIGTSTPSDRLTLANTGAGNQVGVRFVDPSASTYGARMYFDDTPNVFKIVTINNDVESLGIGIARDTGNVGIGTSTPAYKLDVAGATRITGNFTVAGGSYNLAATVVGSSAAANNTAGSRSVSCASGYVRTGCSGGIYGTSAYDADSYTRDSGSLGCITYYSGNDLSGTVYVFAYCLQVTY